MKAAAQKLKMHIGNIDITNNNINVQKVILNSILASFGILAILYMVFLATTVFNIVARRTLETQALTLTNDVSTLELQYLSLSNNVDLPLAYSLGYKAVQPDFATRKTLGSLKLNGNEL